MLLAAFTLALVWNARTIDAAKSGGQAGLQHDAPVIPGWAGVRVGRFSGAPVSESPARMAEPRVSAAATPPRTTPEPRTKVEHVHANPPAKESREFEVTVQSGQTLSQICKAHYRTARSALVEALARHNGLRDAGFLRAGAKLKLPPLDTLSHD